MTRGVAGDGIREGDYRKNGYGEEFLRDARRRLEAAGVSEPRLEAEVMLTDVLGVPRHRIYAYQDDAMPEEAVGTLEKVVERRLGREPLAYILGHREFYGVDLTVGPGVMVPRPETEALVERAMLACLERMGRPGLTVADVGTGSGGNRGELWRCICRGRGSAPRTYIVGGVGSGAGERG